MSPKTIFLALFCLFAFAISVGDCHPGAIFAHKTQFMESYCCGGPFRCIGYCNSHGCSRGSCNTQNYRCENSCSCSNCRRG
ncbi:hypothetical protein QR680_016259 [Steinernema hermaphroditum]|uniref:Uncharacterized protein n=1 Tax=Steinernema hermaphroditum TaxID=289476 RepID=A0AA39LM56_9BILA|nr:hypothetical protein QR680_016259 [Steinernema hermaphroditum]